MALIYQEISDQELWQAIRHDDVKAFNEFFERYYLKLLRLSKRYIVETMTAEELCMDFLHSLWQKRDKLTITGDVSAYLFRCMKNLIIDQLRKNIPITASLDLLRTDEFLDNTNADHKILSAEVKNRYQATLNELSPQRRRVFQLSREENLTYPEIAREMNLSVNTVENYMVAALATFRKGMQEYSTTAVCLLAMFIADKLR